MSTLEEEAKKSISFVEQRAIEAIQEIKRLMAAYQKRFIIYEQASSDLTRLQSLFDSCNKKIELLEAGKDGLKELQEIVKQVIEACAKYKADLIQLLSSGVSESELQGEIIKRKDGFELSVRDYCQPLEALQAKVKSTAFSFFKNKNLLTMRSLLDQIMSLIFIKPEELLLTLGSKYLWKRRRRSIGRLKRKLKPLKAE